ncbi:MAG TPA: T9SS type A sorting domain-containing protein, partial [Bacteroidetes bacterium]|nr:T9SS type A sorting domain-containing protein [Bacteroidota bacterium]
GSLRIDFALGSAGFTTLKVYDLSGRLVETLVSGGHTSGVHSLTWQADGLPSGLYVLKLECGRRSATEKVLIVR